MKVDDVFRLGQDENRLSEYFFRASGDYWGSGIITNRRLIMISEGLVESFPLSKINFVSVGYARSEWMLTMWIILLVIFPLLYSLLYVFRARGSIALIPAMSFFEMIAVVAVLVVGGAALYAWLRGETILRVGHAGGEKSFTKSGKNDALFTFADTLTHNIM